MAIQKTNEEFIMDAKNTHGNRYDYSLSVYTGCFNEIIIICPIHGQFLQTPTLHLLGRGCQKCANVYVRTTEEFIEEINKTHNHKYDYSITVYNGVSSKIEVICPIHGIFQQRAQEHINGRGCPKCARVYSPTTEEYIKMVQDVHGDDLYDYSLTIYENMRKKVKIICKIHGIFEQKASSHLEGCGCKKCKNSHGERRILNFLEKNNIDYINEKAFPECKNPKTNGSLKFDFYIPSKNLLIEFDGAHHFHQTWLKKFTVSKADFDSIQYRDKIKNEFAIIKGIDLLRIPYTKIKSIEKILKEKLLLPLCPSK